MKAIELTEKTSGRDKLCRLVQYGTKFLYWLLELRATSPELVETLKQMEGFFSTARKCEYLNMYSLLPNVFYSMESH